MIRPLGSILALTITAWLPLSDSQAAMAQQDGNTVDPGKLLTAAMNEPESDGNESPRGRGSRDSGRNRDASAHSDRGRTGESERRRGTTGQPGASQKNRSAKNTQSEKEADKPRRSTDATGRRGSEKHRGHEHKDHRFSAGERKGPLPHGPGISRESRGPRPGRSTIQHDHTGHRTSGFSGRHHSGPSPDRSGMNRASRGPQQGRSDARHGRNVQLRRGFSGSDQRGPSSHISRTSHGARGPQQGRSDIGHGPENHRSPVFSNRDRKGPPSHTPGMSSRLRGPRHRDRTSNHATGHRKERGYTADRGGRNRL